MQDVTKKVISTLLTLVVVGSNSMPALVYAASNLENKDENNIEFDAKINGEHSYVANIEEKLNLEINLSSTNDGYIKNGTITIDNSNFKLEKIENESILQTDNKIEFGQIDENNDLNLSIPISFDKTDKTNESYFKKDNLIKLDALYVNENGKEENISKTIQEHLEWNTNAEGQVTQELKRYLKYENKTLLSFVVSSGLKENKIPAVEKTIQMLVPKIEDKEPSKIIVVGDNVKYTYQDQVLTINKNYKDENGNISWNSNDEYLVTYIYDTQQEETKIETATVMGILTASGENIELKTDVISYNLVEQIGNLLESTITSTKEISKGYMYANLNRQEDKLETKYNSTYTINIGYTDLIDEIQITENQSNNETLTRKISINKDELVSILGEDGQIKVFDSNNQELGTLNKETLELNIESYALKFYASKPVQEGNININLEKIINPNIKYMRKAIEQMTELQNSIDVVGLLQNNKISNTTIVNTISLIEPTSSATINVSQENLSTVVKNENVVITATLETKDINDALYTNPELLITLPNQITNVELKDARLIYEDELVPATFRAEGNTIYLKLEGTQTKYNTIPNINGSVIRIVADLTLDNLTVSSKESIKLDYKNGANGETKTVHDEVNIIAPSGFIIANSGKLNEKITTINENGILLTPTNDKEKQINLSGIVVNNIEGNTSGFMILGRIPAQDTETVDMTKNNLNSTFTTTLSSPMSIDGLDADIYYSDNGKASYDLEDEQNNWKKEFNENTKSYLIVARSDVSHAQKIEFNYNIQVPRNLDYANSAKSVFAVLYDNKATEGNNKNLITSKEISVETENIPIIETQITAKDYRTDNVINNKDSIEEGKFIKYTISATNKGKKAAENVEIKVQRPDNSSFYILEYDAENDYYNNHYDNSEELTFNIDKIDAGETKNIDVIVRLNTRIEQDSNLTIRAEIKAENMEETSTASFENTSKEGTLDLQLYTYEADEDIYLNQEMSYYLKIEKYTNEEINNAQVKINIPKYMEIVDPKDGSYNENTRELIYKLEQINGYTSLEFVGKVTYTDEPSQEINLSASVTYDGKDEEIKSNTLKKVVIDTKGFTANLSSNIEGKMLDTDTVEYYLVIKNNSKKDAEIEIYNELPRNIELIRYTVKNGNKTYTQDNVGIDTTVIENLKSGDTLKITIVGKAHKLNSMGQIEQIENTVNVKVNGLDLEVNTVKQEIEGTTNYNTIIEEEKEQSENIYSISGSVWYDENANSKKEETEVGMPQTMLNLFDVNKNELVKDKDGKNLEVYTNDNGEYKFENLNNGEYIVIANYDSEVYKLSHYQVGDYSSNENADFIDSNINEASSNSITINGENIYNIDLGLQDAENFNIEINNKVSKINVINKNGTKTYDFNVNKASINLANIENTTLVVEYTVEVTNKGNIDGYVNKIQNTIPNGMEFVSELNENWYVDSDGNAINTSISNKLIKTGEKEELKLILVRNIQNTEIQLIHSSSEIIDTFNQYGIKESKTNLKEKNVKAADIVITNDKNNQIIQVLAISLGIISLLTLVGVGTYKVFNKNN